MSIRSFNLESGETLFEDDSDKSYVLRHPKGLLPEHAPIRRFKRRKPRYSRVGNVLMMLAKIPRKS